MWRSWVDRINTINKIPEESNVSKEELIKQEQQQARFRDIWQNSTDLLSNEEERSEAFLIELLPCFHETYEQFGVSFAIRAIPDERTFISLITKELISGIRKVPEQKSKVESSQALMDNLRSKSHLYNVIRAIQVVSLGPESTVLLLLQQRIPSVIIKLFRSFIDLSPEYYDHQYDEDMDIVSISETGDIITTILKQFVKNQSVLHRLIAEDTFFMIVRIMTAKPAEQSTQDTEPVYLTWKKRTVEILKQVDMNGEVVQYLHNRRCTDIMIRVWKEYLSNDNLTLVDLREVNLGLDLLHYQFQGSAKIQYNGLYEEMDQAAGYEVLCKLLKTGPFNESVLQLKMEIVNKLVDLAFVGKISPIPSLSDGLPYQHEDFSTPQPKGQTDKIVKNVQAFQCLLAAFIYPSSLTAATAGSGAPTQHETITKLQEKLFRAMKEIIEAHPCNYFVVERTNAMPQFIESMEKYTPEIQEGIMELLIFIMVDLNFVPLKELAVLSLHLQSSSSGKLISLICKHLVQLLQISPKFFVVAQEAGLINIMSLMLSDVADQLQSNSITDSENGEFLTNALESFDQVIQCIIAMTCTPTNVTVFRKSYRGNLFDLLQYPKTRIGALKLFENLSSHAYDYKSVSPSLGSPEPAVEVGNAFSRVMEAIQYIPRDDLDFRLEVLQTIKRIFKAHQSTRDIFRKVGGYVSLVSMIVALEGAFEEPERFYNDHDKDEAAVQQKIVAVIQTIFSVLAESMHHHDINKTYFMKDVGYVSLENAITLTGALNKGCIPHQLFGILFAFAIDDESVYDLFLDNTTTTDTNAVTLDLFRRIELTLRSPSVKLINSEITPSILHLQESIYLVDPQLARAVLCSLYALAQGNRRNQVKMNRSGLILELLKRSFPKNSAPEQEEEQANSEVVTEKEIMIHIIKKLMSMGVSYDELQYMFKGFDVTQHHGLESSNGLIDLVLQGASRSRWPNFIQFDMESNPCASVEIPEVPNFPPPNPGYSILAWIHIERQDDSSNLLLFSVWDDKTLAFQVYVDAKSKLLFVYSVYSKHPIMFKSFEFNSGFWYHIALVHHKSRLSLKSSTMTMYINGVHIEQVSCPYITPSAVPSLPLKAVIGSSNDFKPSQLIWDLGPTYLVQDTLEKEAINLYFNLGARYKSLFQDSLRQFQTYEAATSLFLTLRSMSKPSQRKESAQQMTNALKTTAIQSMQEGKILFALFACNTLSEGKRTGLVSTGVSESTAATIWAEINCSKIILNSAIPKLDTAVYLPKNMGYLVGEPIIAYPFGLDESIWKIGGCAIALKLIERSHTVEMLSKSTAILFEIIRYSWRNSEDMERCHGYEILAYLLKQKRELITVELFELLLVFIGKNPHSPEDSVINNPLAYRFVILNFEIWKKTSIPVQRAQLDQFILFLNTSKMRNFNSRRLPKIHLVKKVLLAFRMNIYAKELIPHLVNSLKAIMLSNWNTDSIRAVATFLASTVSSVTNSTPAQAKAVRPIGRSDSTLSTSSSSSHIDNEGTPAAIEMIFDAVHSSHATKTVQMRNIVLEMLHDILCDKDNGPEYVNKFAVTITNKWPLLFFAPNINPFTVVLALRILARLCISQGPAYVNKFKTASEGFLVMGNLLPQHWNLSQLHETLIAMMMGIDVADFPIYNKFDINNIRKCLQENNGAGKIAIPEVMPVIIALWDEGRKVLEGTPGPTFSPILRSPLRPRSNSTSMRPAKKQPIREASPAARAVISRTLDDFVQLFDELYDTRPNFREACDKQDIADCIVRILFPSVCHTSNMTAEDELNSKDVVLTNFDLDHNTSPSSAMSSPVDSPYYDRFNDDTASIDSSNTAVSIIKRGGTSSLTTKTSPHVSKRGQTFMTRLRSASWSQGNTLIPASNALQDPMLSAVLNFVVDICVQSIIDPNSKNLNGLMLIFSAFPPSTHEQQLVFESFLMTHISQKLKSTFQIDMDLLLDPRIFANVSKFAQLAADTVIQGRFKEGGAEQTYDLLATLLEILHMDDFNRYGSTDASMILLYRSFNRMILVKISDLEHGDLDVLKTIAFLEYCVHHQKIILSPKNADVDFLKCFSYHLYRYLLSNDEKIKNTAANMWKLLILQKLEGVTSLLNVRVKGIDSEDLVEGFTRMVEMDFDTFYRWMDSRKVELNILFNEHICKAWENTIMQEHKYSRETFKNYITKRISKLKKMQKRDYYEQEVILDYTSKTLTWSESIQEFEMSKFTKALQDSDGHENFIQSEWTRLSEDLLRERAIWGPEKADDLKWRLDYTEGPNRMRKRLQYISNNDYSSYLPKQTQLTGSSASLAAKVANTTTTSNKTSADIDKEIADGPGLNGESNGQVTEDDSSMNDEMSKEEQQEEDQQIAYEEDKNRKVLRLLDQGDMVYDVYNISQIAGLDACEGLLILCKNNIYLIDNFFQLSDGEVVEIWDVPKEERDQYLLLVAQAAGMETEPFISSSGDLHTCRKWATADLRDVFKRRFLFRDVALEIFFKDGQNALITLALNERDELYSKLVSRVSAHEESGSALFGRDKDYINSGLSSTFKLSSIFGTSTLFDLTQRWERKQITNFQYLMYLNAIAGRSYNDLTQYPVFPWILADYKSEELDLEDPKIFRDLTRPMGAQTAERRKEFSERYRQWGETDDPTPAFHYGTHYSSAMIVCSFLIRLEPFTQHYLKLQGGTFDHADRLFDSIGKAWESASEKNMGDVRELIPEFFYLPEFLTNVNKFNFGVKQGTGEAIDSIVLPPWAHGDPKIFIQRHREALESEYVSANLHHWIDLIFGYKQQGQPAIDSLNVFHHVSYEGAVNLDAITDIVEKTATIGIINNFGQTPRQLFKKPHPARTPTVTDPMVLGSYIFQDHLDKLMQSLLPLRDIKQQVSNIELYNDKLGVTSCQQLLMPSDGLRYIEWGYTDFSLRLYSTETGKLLNVFENMHVGYISTAYFLDSKTLVTGGTDNLVCLWTVKNEKTTDFALLECLKGHTDTVTTIAASKTYSVLVTGSNDKTAIIWDVNRKKYIQSLTGHENGVQKICINDTTGDIITCSGHTIRVWTVNGDLYLTKSACISSESILSCIFYEHSITEWNSCDLIITGHRRGIVKFWIKKVEKDPETSQCKWSLVPVHQLRHKSRVDSNLDDSDIVALTISNSKRTLFTGSRHGQVYSFVLPDTSDSYHLLREDKFKDCMSCKKSFSVLERKNHCRTCGGIYCSGCMSSTPISCPDKSARFCKNCAEKLLCI